MIDRQLDVYQSLVKNESTVVSEGEGRVGEEGGEEDAKWFVSGQREEPRCQCTHTRLNAKFSLSTPMTSLSSPRPPPKPCPPDPPARIPHPR